MRTVLAIGLALLVGACAANGPRISGSCITIERTAETAVSFPFPVEFTSAGYGESDNVVYELRSPERRGITIHYAPFGGVAASMERTLLFVYDDVTAADGRTMTVRLEKDDRGGVILVGVVTGKYRVEVQLDRPLPAGVDAKDPELALIPLNDPGLYDPFAADVFALFENLGRMVHCP